MDTLNEDGFEAWTPVEIIGKRKRKGEKPALVNGPLMPSFVFARADRLRDLARLARGNVGTFQIFDKTIRRMVTMDRSQSYQVYDAEQGKMVTRTHPNFSVFRQAGQFKLITDRELDPLRVIEQREKPKGKALVWEPGAKVRFTEAGFAGLTGVVLAQKRKKALVKFGHWAIPVEIPAWALFPALDGESAVQLSSGHLDRP